MCCIALKILIPLFVFCHASSAKKASRKCPDFNKISGTINGDIKTEIETIYTAMGENSRFIQSYTSILQKAQPICQMFSQETKNEFRKIDAELIKVLEEFKKDALRTAEQAKVIREKLKTLEKAMILVTPKDNPRCKTENNKKVCVKLVVKDEKYFFTVEVDGRIVEEGSSTLPAEEIMEQMLIKWLLISKEGPQDFQKHCKTEGNKNVCVLIQTIDKQHFVIVIVNEIIVHLEVTKKPIVEILEEQFLKWLDTPSVGYSEVVQCKTKDKKKVCVRVEIKDGRHPFTVIIDGKIVFEGSSSKPVQEILTEQLNVWLKAPLDTYTEAMECRTQKKKKVCVRVELKDGKHFFVVTINELVADRGSSTKPIAQIIHEMLAKWLKAIQKTIDYSSRSFTECKKEDNKKVCVTVEINYGHHFITVKVGDDIVYQGSSTKSVQEIMEEQFSTWLPNSTNISSTVVINCRTGIHMKVCVRVEIKGCEHSYTVTVNKKKVDGGSRTKPVQEIMEEMFKKWFVIPEKHSQDVTKYCKTKEKMKVCVLLAVKDPGYYFTVIVDNNPVRHGTSLKRDFEIQREEFSKYFPVPTTTYSEVMRCRIQNSERVCVRVESKDGKNFFTVTLNEKIVEKGSSTSEMLIILSKKLNEWLMAIRSATDDSSKSFTECKTQKNRKVCVTVEINYERRFVTVTENGKLVYQASSTKSVREIMEEHFSTMLTNPKDISPSLVISCRTVNNKRVCVLVEIKGCQHSYTVTVDVKVVEQGSSTKPIQQINEEMFTKWLPWVPTQTTLRCRTQNNMKTCILVSSDGFTQTFTVTVEDTTFKPVDIKEELIRQGINSKKPSRVIKRCIAKGKQEVCVFVESKGGIQYFKVTENDKKVDAGSSTKTLEETMKEQFDKWISAKKQ